MTDGRVASLDELKIELERRKAELDAEVRRAELEEKRAAREAELEEKRAAREAELEEKRAAREKDQELKGQELRNTAGGGLRFTAAQATVGAAALTLLGGVIGSLIQSSTTRDTEAAKNIALVQIEDLKAKAVIDLEKQKQNSSEKLSRQNFEIGLILKAIGAPTEQERVRSLQFFVEAGFIADDKGRIAAMAAKPASIPFLPPPKAGSSSAGLPSPLVGLLSKYEGADVDWNSVKELVLQVTAAAKVPLNDNQLSALVSFAYHVGLGALRASTLLREVNAGNVDAAADQFGRWVKTGPETNPLLVERRKEEAALFRRAPSEPGADPGSTR